MTKEKILITLSEDIYENLTTYHVSAERIREENLFSRDLFLSTFFSAGNSPVDGHYLIFDQFRNPIGVKHTKEEANKEAYKRALEKAQTWQKHGQQVPYKRIKVEFDDKTSLANRV